MTCTVGELAEFLGATIVGNSQAQLSGVAMPENARAEDLIYVDSPRHQQRAEDSAAQCVLAPAGLQLKGKTILSVENPKLAFAKASARLLPEFAPPPGVHPTAIVASSAKLGLNVFIGPYVVIEDDVEIGGGTIVEAFCFLGRGSTIGEECRLHPRVTLYANSRLAKGVELHSGVVIGGDGFGYVFGEGRHWKFPQTGTVEIGDNVEIGCNTTIDRGSLGATRIAADVKIDNLVQVAHNVSVGEHSILVSQTGIAGSCSLGAGVILGGQVGIGDHCHLEDGVIVGAQGGVPSGKTIRRGQTVWGTPARPFDRYKKQYAALLRLPELVERVGKLEQGKE
ncbi:MAG TPA: UDP-3-O-(3-hydroxymyristoyl)glucosamine N-acyltransferase [Candidatus Acidoferrales bacterium]|jgi:UDP-3-O-[3-hydroxymyristoyl] glucosamine N-acyltransferase|nr:UDP-3-O-(3-hydroxymyristoyl)glucosamine N-acyltransferase [Candidatus Acidoferrales bacterium]